MLGELVNHTAIRVAFEDINAADIAFGDKPEVACLTGKKLKVKEKLGQGAFGITCTCSIDAPCQRSVFAAAWIRAVTAAAAAAAVCTLAASAAFKAESNSASSHAVSMLLANAAYSRSPPWLRHLTPNILFQNTNHFSFSKNGPSICRRSKRVQRNLFTTLTSPLDAKHFISKHKHFSFSKNGPPICRRSKRGLSFDVQCSTQFVHHLDIAT